MAQLAIVFFMKQSTHSWYNFVGWWEASSFECLGWCRLVRQWSQRGRRLQETCVYVAVGSTQESFTAARALLLRLFVRPVLRGGGRIDGSGKATWKEERTGKTSVGQWWQLVVCKEVVSPAQTDQLQVWRIRPVNLWCHWRRRQGDRLHL